MNESDRKFHINYALWGIPHSTQQLEKKFNRIYKLREKVSINFRSSLALLQEFFEKVFYIPFELMSESVVIGSAELKLGELITTTSLKEFLDKNPLSAYEIDGICPIKTTHAVLPDTSFPLMEYKLTIEYISTKKLHQTELLNQYMRHKEIDVQAGGDQGKLHETQISPVREQSLKSSKVAIQEKRHVLSDIPEDRSESNASVQVKVLKSTDSVKKSSPVTQFEKADIESILNSQHVGKLAELPRLFSYNLRFQSIKFNRKPERGTWQFSFFHDKADTQRTFINREINSNDIASDNAITFNDLELKLLFTSHASDIMELIKSSDLCTLCIKGPHGMHAKAQLDCNNLLVGNKEKASGIILLKNQTDNVSALGSIFVYLDDLGINFNAQLRATASSVMQENWESSEVHMTRKLDEQNESYAYEIIEELDKWKLIQQETFIVDLKKKENQLLEELKEKWIQKTMTMEEDLVKKTDKMSSLANTLEEAHNQLKAKDSKYSRDDKEIQIMKQTLEQAYNGQLMAIRERARQLEDELRHELKLKEIRFDDIERCNQQLTNENCELRQRNECLQAEFNELKSNLVPKAEVEKLLQEMVRLLKIGY